MQFLEEKLRKSICSALIRCHIDYACSSWYSGLKEQLKKKLQNCQNETVGFIKNLGPRSHIGFLELNSLNMLNLDFRVKQLRLSHVHKIFNGTGLLYLSEQFIKVFDVTRGSTENFIVPSVNDVAATTFYYSGIKDWNSLPSDVKQKFTFNGFKSAARQYLSVQKQLMESDTYVYC